MRITKVYTRTGDDGTTGLAKGERLSKDSPRIVAFGALDEINASIGVCLSESLLDEISGVLKKIQHVLFNIGGELAVVDEELNLISQDDINDLEKAIDLLNDPLPTLKEFVIPGGSKGTAYLHQARVVCRRSERDLVKLSHKEEINPIHIQYLNRLSDYLFVAARYQNMKDGGGEGMWEKSV